jgi:predicted dehydrogenase
VDRFFRWRLFEDYAGGPVTDLFPHCLTQVIDIMGLGVPDEAAAVGSIDRYEYELREVPDSFNLIAHYPEQLTISLIGTSGNDYQTTEPRGAGQRCPVIRGWEGALTIQGGEIVFIPAGGASKEPQRFPIEHGEDLIVYWKNFLDCVVSRKQETWSPMDLAFRTQTVLQMAMLASRAGRTAKFDPARREIVI